VTRLEIAVFSFTPPFHFTSLPPTNQTLPSPGHLATRNKAAMSSTRMSSRRHRILPARYQDTDSPPSFTLSTNAPRGRKRTRSSYNNNEDTNPPPFKSRKRRLSGEGLTPRLDPIDADISLNHATCSASVDPLRITVPLDIDVSHLQLPDWIDLNTDYWVMWRHNYDKWHIQHKFALVNKFHNRCNRGVDIAAKAIDNLLFIREKLLTDHPDRPDLDLENRNMVKNVWRYLVKAQQDPGAEAVAEFNCVSVAKETRWDVTTNDETLWREIQAFLIEQGNEGKIFIDPRKYYNHFSWCVEDCGSARVSSRQLYGFYEQFGAPVVDEEPQETISCVDCSASAQKCNCGQVCLLCLPHADGYMPVSPQSSLLSPPRTPGTQTMPAYFKGRRLSHPPVRLRKHFTDEEAAGLLLQFADVGTKLERQFKARRR
jgi:hypothetical protein